MSDADRSLKELCNWVHLRQGESICLLIDEALIKFIDLIVIA